MRLDVVTENPLESAAALAGLLPTGVVKVVWSFTLARTLVAAAELGVFQALEPAAKDASSLATELGCDPAALEVLLSALTGFGMLRRRRGMYALPREARRYLTSALGTDLSAALHLGALLDRRFQRLPEVIRTGRHDDFHESLTDDEWSAYLRGLGALAAPSAKEVARLLPLTGARRGLDVGGGHGRFSVALCNRHAGLVMEVLDLPGAVPVGESLVAGTASASASASRVQYRSGDLRESAFGEGLDVVLLFNVLHNLGESEAHSAVMRAVAALRPGGVVAILEGQHRGGDGNLSFQEAFGELFFLVLSGSRTWPEPTLRGWLEQAGAGAVTRKRLFTLPGAVLLLARRERSGDILPASAQGNLVAPRSDDVVGRNRR